MRASRPSEPNPDSAAPPGLVTPSPLGRGKQIPREIMGGNVVSGLFVIGCWAQGAWRAPGGSGVVSRGPAERFCAVTGPIRGEIPPNPPPARDPRAVSVASCRSVYEPEIVDDTKSDHGNISFPTMS